MPGADRYAVPLFQILNGPVRIEVNCNWLRVTSKFPVQVNVDGTDVQRSGSSHIPELGGATGYASSVTGGIEANSLQRGMSYTIRRPVKVVTLSYTGPSGPSAAIGEHVDVVQLFAGRGDIEDVDFGLAGTVAQSLVYVLPAPFIVAFPDAQYPTIMSPLDNQADSDGVRIIPSRWELSGFTILIGWTAGAGVISTIAMGRYTRAGAKNILVHRSYHPGTERFSVEMTNPPIFEGLELRRSTGVQADVSGLGWVIQTSLSMGSIGFDLNWKYWL